MFWPFSLFQRSKKDEDEATQRYGPPCGACGLNGPRVHDESNCPGVQGCAKVVERLKLILGTEGIRRIPNPNPRPKLPITYDEARAALRRRAALERLRVTNPTVIIQEDTSLTDLLAMVAASSVVTPFPVVEAPEPSPAFQGFSGGDSGGAVASDDWQQSQQAATAEAPAPAPAPAPESSPAPEPSCPAPIPDSPSAYDSPSSSYDSGSGSTSCDTGSVDTSGF